jgi:glycosyltransferase involved in cell wall biosynthesis
MVGHASDRWRERLAAADGVDHLGRIPRERLARYYEHARYAVVPSIWPEPLPRAVLEASAMRRAVIATSAGGTADAMIDGETGLLVEPRDTNALAGALVALWKDPATAQRMGDAGRQLVHDRFSADAVAKRAEQLYAASIATDALCAQTATATTRSAVAAPGRVTTSRWRRWARRP